MPHIPGHLMPISAEHEYLENKAINDTVTPTSPQPATVNPYEYYQEFTSTTPTYSAEEAYSDIGISPTLDFLGETDPITGLKYADLIPEYDAYNEESLRTQFRSGVEQGYQGAVGQLGGLMGQARQQSAKAGFAGSGAIQSTVDTSRTDLQKQYGSAFSDALLSLTSGIRQERLGYQESISDLLTGFQEGTEKDILTTETISEQQEGQLSDLDIALTTKTGTHRGFGMFPDYEYANTLHVWDEAQQRYVPT